MLKQVRFHIKHVKKKDKIKRKFFGSSNNSLVYFTGWSKLTRRFILFWGNFDQVNNIHFKVI